MINQMDNKRNFNRGVTLLEMIVSVAILAWLGGMVAWLGRMTVQNRLWSEEKLTLLSHLQRINFRLENDFLSARRYTLGNVLCNNIIFPYAGRSYRTSSDPGFDTDYTPMTNDPTVLDRWYAPSSLVVPLGIGIGTAGAEASAYVDRTVAGRFHGMGSMAIKSSLTINGTYTVRSPVLTNLKSQDYVLAGWVRGEDLGVGQPRLVPEIVLQDSVGVEYPVAATTFGRWVYISRAINSTDVNSALTYHVLLRARVVNANATRVMTARFDDITLTPQVNIAQIDYSAARAAGSTSTSLDLNVRKDLGMVFFKTNVVDGTLHEMKYIFSENDQWTFPPKNPDLLRFSMIVPYRVAPFPITLDPSEPIREESLPNIQTLSVDWVGDWTLGSRRRIKVSVTVRDRKNPNKLLSLERTIFPPTD